MIQSFTPEPFWSIETSVEIGSSGSSIPLNWSRKRLFDESSARLFMRLINESDGGFLKCSNISITQGKHPRPQPMNTVQMLKMASTNLGIGPHACMRAAEHLYLSGYLSYPRTESSSYPSSYDFRETLNYLRDHWDMSGYASSLCRNGFTQPRHGHDAGE
jgi:DNA topoisomerase-3